MLREQRTIFCQGDVQFEGFQAQTFFARSLLQSQSLRLCLRGGQYLVTTLRQGKGRVFANACAGACDENGFRHAVRCVSV